MPESFLSEAERSRFNQFPADLSASELIAHFTLSSADQAQIPATTTPANYLGFALTLITLRYTGFYLPELTNLPVAVINYVAAQLGVSGEQIEGYGMRPATLSAHRAAIENYLGFRHPTHNDFERVSLWLTERALEHDRPTVLLQLLCEHFLTEKLVRPALSTVERMVITARAAAETEIYQRLAPLFDEFKIRDLDALLQTTAPNLGSQLAWLRQSATANNPKTILSSLDKLHKLQEWRVGS